jgi:hypothetical protein
MPLCMCDAKLASLRLPAWSSCRQASVACCCPLICSKGHHLPADWLGVCLPLYLLRSQYLGRQHTSCWIQGCNSLWVVLQAQQYHMHGG